MCTVLFIPGKSGNYFASLRDESPLRPNALEPQIQNLGEAQFLAPQDPLAGGTWVGMNEYRNVIVLLNGGFINHKRKSAYLKSRGIIVSELLKSCLPVVDWNLMDLDCIEPFTLIIWSEEKLFQLVWDGLTKFRTLLDSSIPHIWSSSTLYDAVAKEKRKDYFHNWIAMEPPISKLTILNFFKSLDDNENGFIMNRNEKVKTLSFSFLELPSTKAASFDYFDLINYKHSGKTIEMKSNSKECMIYNLTKN